MKQFILPALFLLVLASCSTPKYSYIFDHHDYNAGKKKKAEVAQASAETAVLPEESPLKLDESTLTASATEAPVVIAEEVKVKEAKENFLRQYNAMSKTEKKAFKKELKNELKQMVKAKKKSDGDQKADATKVMDNDLRLAIIFGAVGLVLSLFGGVSSVFWVLSVIAIVIGVVFLIKWLSRQ